MVGSQEPGFAFETAQSLAALGPRTPESPGHGQAAELLPALMSAAGLQEVEKLSTADGSVHFTGVLPGTGGREILLTAHWDTVAGSPGASDDASGCGVALAAVLDLARTPLRHDVRVILFDREELKPSGAETWARSLDVTARGRILAAIDLEMMGWASARRGVVHTFPVNRGGKRTLAPGWLVHAALKGGRSAGMDLSLADPALTIPAQLVLRSATVLHTASSDSLLEVGVPAVLLTDAAPTRFDPEYHGESDTADRLSPERLQAWAGTVAAIVRRLDALPARPVAESSYLVAFGRVWLRRDLLWFGLLIWIPLVWRGLPGRWRGSTSSERQARGRAYLPGFWFRAILLVSLILTPVFAVTLLTPAALLGHLPPTGPRKRVTIVLLAALPALGWILSVSWALAAGWVALDTAALLPLATVSGSLIAFSLWLSRR